MDERYVTMSYRTKRYTFTERDELAFSRVLREFEPRTIMFEEDGRAPEYQQFTACVPNITHSRSRFLNIYMPSPGQEESWTIPETYIDASRQHICRFVYERGNWAWASLDHKWVFDPPSLSNGLFTAWYPSEDDTMKKFAMRIFRLAKKVTWLKGSRGLDAVLWSQTGGVVRRSFGGYPISTEHPSQLNKYYDDSLWDDRLPEVSTMGGIEYLEHHNDLRKERGSDDPPEFRR